MKSIFFFHYALQLTILTQVHFKHANAWSPVTIREGVSNILFGPLWRFGEYCGDTRDGLFESDEDIQSFFNGSSLNSLRRSNVSEITSNLSKLAYYGINARIFTSLICSINSWGYSEEEVFKQSNQPYDDDIKCQSELEEMCCSLQTQVNRSCDAVVPFNQETSDRKSSTLCIENSTKVLDRLSQINSFGRVPSGPFFKQNIWLGDYKECTRYSSMRYCIGAYRSQAWPLEEENSNFMTAIRIGLCLPRACNSRTAKSKNNFHIIRSLVEHNLPGKEDLMRLPFELTDIYCPPAEDSYYKSPFKDPLSVVLVLIAVIWLLTLLFASCRKLSSNPLLKKFNLQLVWREFMKDDHIASELAGLNFIKVFCQIWIMAGHTYLHVFNNMKDKQEMSDQMSKSMFNALLSQAQDIVPAFFIITGFLISYRCLRKPVDYKRLIFHRYVRLLPMYLVVYAYVKKFSHMTGSGPLWDHGVSPQSELHQCSSESWFVPILMLANFIPPFTHCILTGWHVANDFQLYLYLPVLLYAYRKSRVRGTVLAISTVAASNLYLMWIFYGSDKFSFTHLGHSQYIFGPVMLVGRVARAYVHPMGRIGGFAMGVILADLLIARRESLSSQNDANNRPTSKSNATKQEKNFRLFTKIAGPWGLLILWLFMMATNAEYDYIDFYGRYNDMVTIPLMRYAIEHGWFLILFSLLMNRAEEESSFEDKSRQATSNENTKGNNLLARLKTLEPPRLEFIRFKIWNILVKLNYCLILTHFTVSRYVIQTQTTLMEFSQMQLFQSILSVISLAYITAFILHLTVEVPLTALVNHFVSLLDHKKSSKGVSATSASKNSTPMNHLKEPEKNDS